MHAAATLHPKILKARFNRCLSADSRAANDCGLLAQRWRQLDARIAKGLASRDHREGALGLGLPLTRQFIEAHNGTVELESERGKGTIVTLTIPRGTR